MNKCFFVLVNYVFDIVPLFYALGEVTLFYLFVVICSFISETRRNKIVLRNECLESKEKDRMALVSRLS